MNNLNFKTLLPHLLALAVFLIVACAYFSPVLSGKSLQMGDMQKFKGMSKEIRDYEEKTGDKPLWTNQMFGGMPSYQISADYSTSLFKEFNRMIARVLPFPLGVVFLSFIGFYIFLLTLKIKPYAALIGALAFGFSSYTFTIIEAGHTSKTVAIVYMAPLLAGIVFTLRGNLLWGGVLPGIGMALQLSANHFQITFYTGFAAAILVWVHFRHALVDKKLADFSKALAVLALAVLLGIGANFSIIWTTYEYADYTIRGKSELTKQPGAAESDDKKPQDGLDFTYVTNWSYGIDETWSLLVPDFKGGATGAIGSENEEALKGVKPQYKQSIAGQNQYFGDQPFTSGPVYFGALVIFFFVLGLLLVDGPLKWSILGIVGISMFLSWGRNFFPLSGAIAFFFAVAAGAAYAHRFKENRWPGMTGLVLGFAISVMAAQGDEPSMIGVLFGTVIQLAGLGYMYTKTKQLPYVSGALALLSQLLIIYYVSDPTAGLHTSLSVWMFENVPMYNKFRTVSMTLVMAQVVVPVLAFLGLDYFLKNQELARKNLVWVGVAFVLTGGVSLYFYLFPHSVNDFFATGEANRLTKQLADANFPQSQAKDYIGQLSIARTAIFQSDALRSALFIIGGLGLILLFAFKILKSLPVIAGLGLLILADMWNVDTRYVNKDNFVSKRQYDVPYQADAADNQILQDPDIHYRVYNTTRRPDQDGVTPFFHKSIGGYHAAKLRRVQDVITAHLLRGNQEILHMLNAKYVIVGAKEGRAAQRNFNALGNAWFVKEVAQVANPDEELAGLKNLRTADKAIYDQRFAGELEGFTPNYDAQGEITLTDYHPETMTYASNAASEQLAVFSEIYYDKGWNAYIDGKLVPHLRVNYVLRALRVPAGQHRIEFRFEPKSYSIGSSIALICCLTLIGGLGFLIFRSLKPAAAPKG
ncbi:MAG: YfhO family protein [Salibacteraceae bacterium]